VKKGYVLSEENLHFLSVKKGGARSLERKKEREKERKKNGERKKRVENISMAWGTLPEVQVPSGTIGVFVRWDGRGWDRTRKKSPHRKASNPDVLVSRWYGTFSSLYFFFVQLLLFSLL
jgi:hypothetical protein